MGYKGLTQHTCSIFSSHSCWEPAPELGARTEGRRGNAGNKRLRPQRIDFSWKSSISAHQQFSNNPHLPRSFPPARSTLLHPSAPAPAAQRSYSCCKVRDNAPRGDGEGLLTHSTFARFTLVPRCAKKRLDLLLWCNITRSRSRRSGWDRSSKNDACVTETHALARKYFQGVMALLFFQLILDLKEMSNGLQAHLNVPGTRVAGGSATATPASSRGCRGATLCPQVLTPAPGTAC